MVSDLNSRIIANFQDFIPCDKIEYIIGETGYPTDPFEMIRASKDEAKIHLVSHLWIYAVCKISLF